MPWQVVLKLVSDTFRKPRWPGEMSTYQRFSRSDQAIALVEFALLLPVLILLLFGTAEFSQAYHEKQKLLRATNIIGDLITRQAVQTRGQINQIIRAAEAVVDPNNPNRLSVKITAIAPDPDTGEYHVAWSHTRRAAADITGNVFELPEQHRTDAAFLIVVTLTSTYSGQFTNLFIDSIDMTQQLEFVPRDSDRIDLSSNPGQNNRLALTIKRQWENQTT